MIRVYHLGDDDNSVSLKVTPSTSGIVYTVATKRRSGGSSVEVAESANANGKISKKVIGTAKILRNTVLDVLTIIDLSPIDPLNWQAAYDNLLINYTLEGGLDGIQPFGYDPDDKAKSKTGNIVVVKKAIRLS